MPLASISKVTSICGVPRGAGGIVGGHFSLTLENANGDRTLVILRRREHLALLRRHRGVAFNQAREHAAQRFKSERQRRHVEQQDVLDVALKHTGLDRRADRNHLVGIDALVWLLAEDLLHNLLDLRHPGHAADQHHFADVAGCQSGILERVETWFNGLLHEIIDQ
jgi:hypothetical protein